MIFFTTKGHGKARIRICRQVGVCFPPLCALFGEASSTQVTAGALNPEPCALSGGPLSRYQRADRHSLLGLSLPRVREELRPALIQAAEKRGIPAHTIPGLRSYARLGYGQRQKPLLETITVDTSSYASQVSRSKIMTSVLLGTIGVPAPRFRAVKNEQQAVQASRDFSEMMVVKPAMGMSPPIPLPQVSISGTTLLCSMDHILPVRPVPA